MVSSSVIAKARWPLCGPAGISMPPLLVSPQCPFHNLELSSLGDSGIQLQVSPQLCGTSPGQVVSVLVALEELRAVPTICTQDLQGDDLRSLFFFIFEEGTSSERGHTSHRRSRPSQSP